MPSMIFNSCLDDLARGAIDFDTDTFWVMLSTNAYTPNKDTHLKRSDVTNEVTGTGYSAGGKVIAALVTKDTANDRVDITFGPVTWNTATITARYATIYKRRGGAASADELVATNDFGADVTSTGGDFTVNAMTLRFQN